MDTAAFLSRHELPPQYAAQITHYFTPLAQQIMTVKKPGLPLVVTINGAQGSGKSTLADYLACYLREEGRLNACASSLDDFYYSQAQRNELAQQVHPLLATRGVPGTHDIARLHKLVEGVREGLAPLSVPRFDKAMDEPCASAEWQHFSRPIEVLIVEGWCVGTPPQSEEALRVPINELEQQQDVDGRWRRYVNTCLEQHYQPLFASADISIMLKAPSFDAVLAWRWQQEQKLIARVGHTAHTMSKAQVADFIGYFERLTRHALSQLPHRTQVVLELDLERHITAYHNAL
ncbi:kinase [Pseudoalteromonas sp. BDTF-M6]|uniref:kinase n=1 Tax=Pseudoalteromonas sp. BDTF-M6 TaxID=2796132 RepID=UPI001BAF6BAF|nr:kinase [Pseudoalteromonas sp. BDTF-M6]MBS3797467.1 kinase [Pseudoalteromonas sp. BDTF-M6]